MRRRVLRLLLAAPLFLAVGGTAIVALFMASTMSSSTMTVPGALGACTVDLDGLGPSPTLDSDQLANARVIIEVGSNMTVPARGIVIALATAMQESQLRNLDYGHADSVGLFQQRPSQGWGSVAELTDPPTSSRKFYDALLKVEGWQQMPLTVAAQTVQRSAFPLAYAKWEPLATRLAGGATVECAETVSMPLPAGAVGEMLRVALAQQGDPYIWGATGPDAFDCSGLIVYAWRQAGYRLTIRTADQMYRSSSPVPAGQEQPGDLLFGEFGSRVPGAGHVMIVVEAGLALEAPSAGKNVRLRRYDGVPAAGYRFGRLHGSVLQPLGSAA